jgi:heterodisulfide reductase subunit B
MMQTEQYGYELSIRKIFPEFGVELVDLQNISCCGAPMKSINLFMQTYLSARNMTIFEKKGLDIFTPCPQCNLSFLETKQRLEGSVELRDKINSMLEREEGLEYSGNVNIYHTLDLLHDVVGTELIAEKVTRTLDLRIACHEGCQTVRYTEMARPDGSERPSKMGRIITAIGGTTSYYSEELNCCGAPLLVTHKESAFTKAGEKLKAVKDRDFEVLSIVCPLGGSILESKQDRASAMIGEKSDLPVLYLTQLIGLSMGMNSSELGLKLNKSPWKRLFG